MANSTFTQTISLEGGDQVAQQLKAIGQTGSQAFKQIGDATREATNAFSEIGSQLQAAFGPLVGLIAGVTAAFAALDTAVKAAGVSAAQSTNQLVETAKGLKTTTDQIQRLQFAASTAGIGQDKLSTWLKTTKSAMDEATKSARSHFRAVGDLGSQSATFFANAGASVLRPAPSGSQGKTDVRFDGIISKDALGDARDYQSVLQKIGETLAALDDGPRKDSFIAGLKAKGYGDDIEKLEDLARTIKTTKEVFDRLGLAETDQAKEVASTWSESFKRLSQNLSEQKAIITASISAITHEIGLLFTPYATQSQDSLSDFIEKHRLAIADFVADYVRPAIAAVREFVQVNVIPNIASGWEQLKSAAASVWPIIKQIGSGIQQAFTLVMNAADGAAKVINSVFGTSFTGPSLLATAIIAKFAASLVEIPGWLKAIAVVLTPIAALFTTFAAAVRGAVAAIDFILGKVQALADGLENRLLAELRKLVGPELWDGLKSAAQLALDVISAALNRLAAAARSAWAAIKGGGGAPTPVGDGGDAIGNAANGSGGTDSGPSGYASGGFLSGPGTGTSDSILARLSNGEFVVNARAVAHWGADLFHMLNNLQMPAFASGGIIGDLITPRFAFGGVVNTTAISLPKFAEGGLASRSERHGLISFPLDLGGNQHEVYADRDTVAQLKRQSALAQIASTTKRSPGWNR